MNERGNIPLDRRAALAGSAGLLLASLSRSVSANGSEEDRAPLGLCCGNGPPNVAAYGTGVNISSPQPCGPSFQFDDAKFGKKGSKGVYYWVFVPDQDDHSMTWTYTNPPVKFYVNPAGYTGIVFCVEPANTLVLTWPGATQPTFSTRPVSNNE